MPALEQGLGTKLVTGFRWWTGPRSDKSSLHLRAEGSLVLGEVQDGREVSLYIFSTGDCR